MFDSDWSLPPPWVADGGGKVSPKVRFRMLPVLAILNNGDVMTAL